MPPTRLETKTPFSPPAVADLVNIGSVEQTSGLVLGRAYAHDKDMRDKSAQNVKDQSYGTDLPTLLNVDVGRTDPILAVTLNAIVNLDFEMDDFTVLELV